MIAKYDLIVKKLFDAILSLDRNQQMQVLSYVEDLIIENKREYARKQCDIPVTYAALNRICSDNITNIAKMAYSLKRTDLWKSVKQFHYRSICKAMIAHLKSEA